MRRLLFVLGLACLAAPSFAQTQTQPGFRLASVTPAPSAFGTYATLSSGEVFGFDGQSCDLFAPDGQLLSHLGSLPGATFTSFAILDPSESFALIGENSVGEIYSVDLAGGGLQLVSTLAFNFDARFDIDPGFVWVSAATGGFGLGNDILRLELATGSATLVAHVDGPSGPLDVDAAGDLWYVTLDPNFSPADGSQLLRWSRADLLSGATLSEADAALVTRDLDGASTLRVSPIAGHVFVAEANFAAASQKLLEISPDTGEILDVVAETLTWPGNLEFFTSAGSGSFHEYQPAGVHAVWGDTDFGSGTQQRVRIEPLRPSVSLAGASSGPAAMTLSFSDCEPNAAVLLFFGSIGDVQVPELQFDLGFGAPFHSAFAMNRIHRLSLLTPTDANGEASYQYFDSGSLHGTLAFQAAVLSPSARLLGSTTSVAN